MTTCGTDSNKDKEGNKRCAKCLLITMLIYSNGFLRLIKHFYIEVYLNTLRWLRAKKKNTVVSGVLSCHGP